jgi:glycosyltransferase involved in cell wall biosynthesis
MLKGYFPKTRCIPVRFLFALGYEHLPQRFGGTMSSTHDLARKLEMRGHQVSVLARLRPDDAMGIYTRLLGKLRDKKTVYDAYLGYKTYRRWDVVHALADIVEVVRPAVAIVHGFRQIEIAKELRRLSIPVILYFRDVQFKLLDGNPLELDRALFLANSEFTAKKVFERFGITARVIPPMFDKTAYLTARRPENVTFINPLPLKGSELAFELVARCPEIPFLFLESWQLPKKQIDHIRDFMRQHKNLSFRRRTNNMKAVYRRAKIVMVPSKWEEAWGRVVTEAQYSGIPILASNRGGLPESVGPGGVLLHPNEPVDTWVEILRRLWHDDAYYSDLSAHALAYAARPEIDPEVQIDRLVAAANDAVANSF